MLKFRRAGDEELGGAAWLDFNNDGNIDFFASSSSGVDGDLDLFKTGSLPTFNVIGSQASPGEFFRNEGDAGFVRDFDATGIDISDDYVSGVAQVDFNGDGFPDIVAIRTALQVNLPIVGLVFDLPNGQPVQKVIEWG
jgi:hypothetical protein